MSKKPSIPLPDWPHDFDMEALAARFDTPFYLYDAETLRASCRRFRQAFGAEVSLYYAVKANANVAILQLMRREGLVDGLDIASPGELQQARLAGWSPGSLSYTGPAKRLDALQAALEIQVGTICVESLHELEQLQALAATMMSEGSSLATKVMLRINPAEELHAFGMQISGRASPFGIDEEELDSLLPLLPGLFAKGPLPLVGLHVHAGSQCFSARAMGRSMARGLKIGRRFEAAGVPVPSINFGGGFGVASWRPPQLLDPGSVAGQLRGHLTHYPRELQLRLEPGRALPGPAGIFVARVVQTKVSRGVSFAILDGGMNHYYTATGAELRSPQKPIWVENLSRPDADASTHQLCGPLCTTRDLVGHHVNLPTPQVGDLLGWPNAGAYGLTASPFFFLGHPTPTEILHDRGSFHVIRERVSLDVLGDNLL